MLVVGVREQGIDWLVVVVVVDISKWSHVTLVDFLRARGLISRKSALDLSTRRELKGFQGGLLKVVNQQRIEVSPQWLSALKLEKDLIGAIEKECQVLLQLIAEGGSPPFPFLFVC